MSLLCYLAALWSSLLTLASVTGHDYRAVECNDQNLQLLRCARCEKWSVGWRWKRPRGWGGA